MPLIPPNRVTAFPLKDDLQWYDPDVVFQPFDDLFGRGVIGSTDLQVVANATPDGQISVNPGRGYVPYQSGGKRMFRTAVALRSDAVEFQHAIGAYTGTPRVDRIVAKILDATLNPPDSLKGGVFDVLAGTPTAGATLVNLSGAATVPSSALLLGNVLVSGATIPSGNVDSTFGTVRARARVGAGNSPAKGIMVGGAAMTDRTNLNLIAGTGITLTPTDNPGNDSADITVVNSQPAYVPELKMLMDYTVSAAGGDVNLDTNTILGGALPTTYKALLIRTFLAGTNAGNDGLVKCQFNGDTNNNYDNGFYYDSGSGWNSADSTTAVANFTISTITLASIFRFSVMEILIPNYADAADPRTVIMHGVHPIIYGSGTFGISLLQGGAVWRQVTGQSDQAISRLRLAVGSGGNFRKNSRITIWGM